MRKLILSLVIIFGLSSFNLCAFSAPEDIIYVDLFEIFSKYEKTEDYDKMLEKKQSKEEEGLSEKKKEIEKLREELKLLKESQREEKRKEIEDRATTFESERRQALLDLKRERDDKMKEILKDIEGAVENYARRNKISVVLKKAAISYGNARMDKTKEIINILNRNYKK